MADVYLAVPQGKEPSWHDALVVKRLKPDLVFESDYRAMFKDEAKLALKLDHPNIVTATEMGEVDGQPYLAMEFLQGQPLDKILEASEKDRLTRGEILRIMSDLLAGMHHAHELKGDDGEPLEIVHRDVSPHNVFVTYDGRVKLVDFGIAKSRDKAQHTSTGVVKGKISYMAPEQALCSLVDKRADVFAAGVILWELITGKRFWGDLSDVQILKTMTFGELPQLEDHLPNASPELIAICGKALAITSDLRYASAAEFRADVDRFIARLGENVSAEDIGHAVGRVAGDKRRALDHVIEQQFGRRSLIVRDDTPLNVEMPARDIIVDGTVRTAPPLDASDAEAKSRATRPEGAGHRDLADVVPAVNADDLPSSDSRPRASTLDPVSASGRARLANEGFAPDDRAPAPTWTAPSRKALVWPWVALGIVLLGGTVAVGFRGLSSAGTREGEANSVAASSAPTPRAPRDGSGGQGSQQTGDAAVAGTSPGAPSNAASSLPVPSTPDLELVSFHLVVTPSDAKVRLDGTLLSDNPFTAKFKKDGVAHKLTIESPGYRSISQMLVFNHDIDLKPTLDPSFGGAKHPPVVSGAPTSTPNVVDPSDPWAKKKPKK